MIASSPRRSTIFLLASSLAFFGPDLLVPDAVGETQLYLVLSNFYQLVLVFLWFRFAPKICQALVDRELTEGDLRGRVEAAIDDLRRHSGSESLPGLPVTLSDNDTPFVFTAGLAPAQCHVFLSSGLARQLGSEGLHFVMARALVHGIWSQRLASLLPAVAFTMTFNDIPSSFVEWLGLASGLFACLIAHWVFELYADRQSAIHVGRHALTGLQQLLSVNSGKGHWLAFNPPARWRSRVVTGVISRGAVELP